MTSSENLPSFEPWMGFRPAFADPWISEAYARDTQTFTKVLQKSLCGNSANDNSVSETLTSDSFNPFLSLLNSDAITGAAAVPPPPTTPTASNVSGSDPETAPKRQRNSAPGATGKVSKRKSRASKRSQTTFITADPANFRQMVQQVTGVRFGNAQMPMVPVLKPEPQRLGGRLQGCGGAAAAVGCLPTLDTSAFLLDQVVMGSTPCSGAGPVVGSGPMCFSQSLVGDISGSGSASGSRSGSGSASASGIDFDTFSSFPTLESWKVM